jgi:hypothetical protein
MILFGMTFWKAKKRVGKGQNVKQAVWISHDWLASRAITNLYSCPSGKESSYGEWTREHIKNEAWPVQGSMENLTEGKQGKVPTITIVL